MSDNFINAPVTVSTTDINAPITLARDAYQLALAEMISDGVATEDLPTREEWLASLGSGGLASQSVSIVRAATSVTETALNVLTVTAFSALVKSLLVGDIMLLGPGVYEWEGSFLNVPEQGNLSDEAWAAAMDSWYATKNWYDVDYVDWGFPDNVTIKSVVPGAATIKFVKGKLTWYGFQKPLMAMVYPTRFEHTPMFYGAPNGTQYSVAVGVHFIGLVFDMNAEGNIAMDTASSETVPGPETLSPCGNHQHFHPPLVFNEDTQLWEGGFLEEALGTVPPIPWKGMNPAYTLAVRFVDSVWDNCRVINWSAGGCVGFYGTTPLDWNTYVGLNTDNQIFRKSEHFVFTLDGGSIMRNCHASDPYDVSLGLGPCDDQSDEASPYDAGGSQMFNAGVYVSVMGGAFNSKCEDCTVTMPDYRIFLDSGGSGLPENYKWWREMNTKWRMPDGTVGRYQAVINAFGLGYEDAVLTPDLAGVVELTNCRAKNVSVGFYRDTGAAQQCSVRNCYVLGVQGVANLIPAGTMQAPMIIDGNHFEVIDCWYGNNPTMSVDYTYLDGEDHIVYDPGPGAGYEAGVRLLAWNSTANNPGGIYNGVQITNNVIHPVRKNWEVGGYESISESTALAGAFAIRIDTNAPGIAGTGDATHEADTGTFRNVILKNNTVYGGLKTAVIEGNTQTRVLTVTEVDPMNWESDPLPSGAPYQSATPPSDPVANPVWFCTTDETLNVWDPVQSVWINTGYPASGIPLVYTIAFCGDSITNNIGGKRTALRNLGYMAQGYGSWLITSLGFAVGGTSNPIGYAYPDLDFGADGFTANLWNTYAVFGGKTMSQLAIESTPDAFVVMLGTNGVIEETTEQLLADVSEVLIPLISTGARVFVCSLPPRTGTGAKSKVDAYNAALPAMVAEAKAAAIDAALPTVLETSDCIAVMIHEGLVDENGDQIEEYFLDGVHPNPAGAARMGLALAAAMSPYINLVEFSVPSAVSSRWKTPNPYITAYADGVPTGWLNQFNWPDAFGERVTARGLNWYQITEPTNPGVKWCLVVIPDLTVVTLAGAETLVRGVCRYEIMSEGNGGVGLVVEGKDGIGDVTTYASCLDDVEYSAPSLPLHTGLLMTEPLKFTAGSATAHVRFHFWGACVVRITQLGLITAV